MSAFRRMVALLAGGVILTTAAAAEAAKVSGTIYWGGQPLSAGLAPGIYVSFWNEHDGLHTPVNADGTYSHANVPASPETEIEVFVASHGDEPCRPLVSREVNLSGDRVVDFDLSSVAGRVVGNIDAAGLTNLRLDSLCHEIAVGVDGSFETLW